MAMTASSSGTVVYTVSAQLKRLRHQTATHFNAGQFSLVSQFEDYCDDLFSVILLPSLSSAKFQKIPIVAGFICVMFSIITACVTMVISNSWDFPRLIDIAVYILFLIMYCSLISLALIVLLFSLYNAGLVYMALFKRVQLLQECLRVHIDPLYECQHHIRNLHWSWQTWWEARQVLFILFLFSCSSSTIYLFCL